MKRSGIKRGSRTLLLVIVMSMLAAGCYVSYTVGIDPHKALAADWFAGVPVERGYPTACHEAYSTQFSGAGWQCRSVHGVEEAGDHRNFFVDPGGEGDLSNEGIKSREGTSGSSRGVTLYMEDNKVFEGCKWTSYNNTWICDYYSRMWSVPFKTGTASEYLRATFVNWSDYAVDTLACAGALTGGFMYKKTWTLTALKDCARGPL